MGLGRALRSILPFGVSGIRSSSTICDGTMISGRVSAKLVAQCRRISALAGDIAHQTHIAGAEGHRMHHACGNAGGSTQAPLQSRPVRSGGHGFSPDCRSGPETPTFHPAGGAPDRRCDRIVCPIIDEPLCRQVRALPIAIGHPCPADPQLPFHQIGQGAPMRRCAPKAWYWQSVPPAGFYPPPHPAAPPKTRSWFRSAHTCSADAPSGLRESQRARSGGKASPPTIRQSSCASAGVPGRNVAIDGVHCRWVMARSPHLRPR